MRAKLSSNMSKELVCVHSFVEYIMCTLQMWSLRVLIKFFIGVLLLQARRRRGRGGWGGGAKAPHFFATK